ncbi:transmembrane protein 9B-like isoform X2 [Paramacrobiotus metropolitanus]|uniref:transmembrane protein 9B-like isoform X2 n=1 Tax=Paramacrobiotus metropolitanus TaxID=2943436 RepID=UPI002445FA53|nr:transmembrane protein 9B-like isoform X2 [Paramacrobiotus metropolitanus]
MDLNIARALKTWRSYNFIIVSMLLLFVTTRAYGTDDNEDHSDKRCKCICPRINGTGRAVYIRNVNPEQCNCDHVVLPNVTSMADGQKVTAGEFCAKCQCKHQNRNSLTIKIVVIAFIVITGILMVYMVYLLLEARFFKPTKAVVEDTSVPYEQHLDDEGYGRNGGERRRTLSITGRLSDQMARWKRAVTQQRGNVYIRRTVLNN